LDGRFFKVVPSHIKDLAVKPGFTPLVAPSLLDWFIGAITLRHVWASPNTVWSIIALGMYFLVPYDLTRGSAAASAPLSLAFFWQRFPLWAVTTFGYTAFWHVTLYGFGWADRPFVPGRMYKFTKTLHNMGYSLSGVAIWVAFENVFAFLWATGRLPYLSNAAAFADWKGLALFLGGLAFTPVWRDAHFYFAHRLLHYKPLYRQVHSLHHRNQDIEPFAGLCMHPIEHLYYYSCILPNLVPFICSPFAFLWNGVHLLLAPGASHSGFEDHFQADGFHYMHHRYFECNYAGFGAAALDKAFGTFKANFNEAQTDEPVKTFADAKSRFIVDAKDGVPSLNLPTNEYVAYMALSVGCLCVWAWAAVGLPGLPPFPLPLTQNVAWGVSILAGFGPVWAAQLMGLKLLGGDGNWVIVEGGGWGKWLASMFHYVIGVFFCSVPITYACYLALPK